MAVTQSKPTDTKWTVSGHASVLCTHDGVLGNLRLVPGVVCAFHFEENAGAESDLRRGGVDPLARALAFLDRLAAFDVGTIRAVISTCRFAKPRSSMARILITSPTRPL